jgi:hypothetical protein
MLFVPSEFIKEWMENYLHALSLPTLPKIIVNPYPVSPLLSKKLEKTDFEKKLYQVVQRKKKRMRIILPISGAAVQLTFLKDVITVLTKKSQTDITVVARDSSYTKPFLRWCAQNERVHVLADTYDWDVVASYEYAYRRNVYALEISKPSEQAFKVLLDPIKRGGVIMLFSTPVGSQEYDNVAFLKRHGFIPHDEDARILDMLYRRNKKDEITPEFLSRAKNWRGIMLPYSGKVAGRAILRLKRAGIFQAMMEYQRKNTELEVKDNGVELFWDRIEKEILRLS